MNSQEKCPDTFKVLSKLKDFQKKSVDRVFQRFYKDKDFTNRFLIADEVGLGKTLVARGIIAKSVEYLWDKVRRIDVIYICSNREIASQNINRLNITSAKQFSLVSRMTLLPLKITGLKNRRLNFISFTPGTSFDLHSRTGIMLERALLYNILKKHWNLTKMGPINVFQDWASRKNWHELLSYFPKYYSIDEDLAEEFTKALDAKIEEDKKEGKPDIKSRFLDLCQRFKVYKMSKNVPARDRRDVASVIGEMRMILAHACLEALEPDIVILDEFQRFKNLLDGKDAMSRLAQHLFNYKNKEMPTKIILLSATPYKMYTMHQEEDIDNHYEDFIRTIGFLFNSDEKTKRFEEKLRRFRNELFNIKANKFETLKGIKNEIEEDLQAVMIRTERLAHTLDRNGMVKETKKTFCSVHLKDLESFSVLDKLSQELGTCDIVEYWKSAPYLLNFMDEYEFKRRFKKEIKDNGNRTIVKLVKKNIDKMLKWGTIESFEQIEPANAKLRMLIENGIDKDTWKLLWVPPSLPYYKPRSAYKDRNLQTYTKSLIFSSWQVVPKVIAMICSYEAERRMVKAFRGAKSNYREERKNRRPLIIFTSKEERLAGMANLTLLYPCLTLAKEIDPLKIALEIMPKNGPPSYMRLKVEIRKRIEELLEKVVGFSEERSGRIDERWYWAAPALLDGYYHVDEINAWFSSKDNGCRWEEIIKPRGELDKETLFRQHVLRFKEIFNKPENLELGRRPRDLVDILTKQALASPAVVALRSLLRLRSDGNSISIAPVLQSAASIGAGFRILYNLPESITLIRSINDKEPYWERVLDYGISGNLQSVMDEYVHILKESLGLIDHPYEEEVMLIAKAVYSAVSIRTVNLDFDDVEVTPRLWKVKLNKCSIRCRYALRLGEGKSEGEEEVTRSDQVRASFNSPFRPFLLATTSIGQEGLDFHQYCHSIYHWNLPSNPVDLEQREGRIHRYKGLVIRRNLAKHFGLDILKENYRDFGKEINDPWDFLFSKGVAIRKDGEDDIVPFWIFETKNGLKIDRNIPCMPMSRDIERLRDLKRTLVMYRMVFGQPRQEDLIEFLKKAADEKGILKEIQNFRIDLSPK